MSLPVCAIDPGAGGGIAFYADASKVFAVPMPRDSKELWDYFNYLQTTYGKYITFIEKVNVFRTDDDSPGKKFGIEKLLANYNQVVSILVANDIPVVEVASITWQKGLGLYLPKLDKTVRKNKYKRYASAKYPTVKPTLKTADALCILAFGRNAVATSPKWCKDRIKNKATLNLFT